MKLPAGSFIGTPMKDQACVSGTMFKICDEWSSFYMIESGSWEYPNILGLQAPNKTDAPVFIKNLTDSGFIDNSIAVVYISPSKSSFINLGGVPDGLI